MAILDMHVAATAIDHRQVRRAIPPVQETLTANPRLLHALKEVNFPRYSILGDSYDKLGATSVLHIDYESRHLEKLSAGLSKLLAAAVGNRSP